MMNMPYYTYWKEPDGFRPASVTKQGNAQRLSAVVRFFVR